MSTKLRGYYSKLINQDKLIIPGHSRKMTNDVSLISFQDFILMQYFTTCLSHMLPQIRLRMFYIQAKL